MGWLPIHRARELSHREELSMSIDRCVKMKLAEAVLKVKSWLVLS
jgi:hypothetical protein